MVNKTGLGGLPYDVYPERPGPMGNPPRAKRGPRWQNTIEFINTGFIAQLTSLEALPANWNRNYFLIQNKGANDVYVAFGNPVAPNYFNGAIIYAGGFYEPYKAPRNSVHIIGTAANLTCVLIEGIQS